MIKTFHLSKILSFLSLPALFTPLCSVLWSPPLSLSFFYPQAEIYTTLRNGEWREAAEQIFSICLDSLSRGQCGNVINGNFRAERQPKRDRELEENERQ